jgi:hypothetical protein
MSTGRAPCAAASVGAALAATRLLQATGFDQGCDREQARSHTFRRRPGRRNSVEGSIHRRDLDPAPRTALRCCRGQKTPPTKPRLRSAMGRAPSLPQDPGFRRRSGTIPVEAERPPWERPWPRHGCCGPPASIKAAIASKLAPTVFDAGLSERPSGRRALLPTGPRAGAPLCPPLLSGQKTPPPRLRSRQGSDFVGATSGRDAASAGRRLRSRPQSRASSLPQHARSHSKFGPAVFGAGLGEGPL